MNVVQKYAHGLQIIIVILAFILLSSVCIKWFGTLFFPKMSWSTSCIRDAYSFNGNWFAPSAGMSLLQKILGFIVDGIGLGIIFACIVTFYQLLRRINSGSFFTNDIIRLLNRLKKLAFCWILYNPIRTILISLITTFHESPGHRIISVEFGLTDIINIFIFVCIVLITAFIQEGVKLKKEQDLTI